jgi:hypothetical protein
VLQRSGCRPEFGQHVLRPMVEAMILECEAVRERSARIIREAAMRGAKLINPVEPNETDALMRLAFIVENHYVDEHGEIQVAFPEED